jgi:hypothetical protein
MKSRFAILFALLFLFGQLFYLPVPMMHAQSGGEPEDVPFHITSIGTPFGLQGEFEGTYRVGDYSIEVSVRKATFYVSEKCPYKGRRLLNYVKFGTWKLDAPKGKWRMENSSSPLLLGLTLSPYESFDFYDLHFSLPKDNETDLRGSAFVVQMQEDAPDLPSEKPGTGFAFARSREEIYSNRRSESARK